MSKQIKFQPLPEIKIAKHENIAVQLWLLLECHKFSDYKGVRFIATEVIIHIPLKHYNLLNVTNST